MGKPVIFISHIIEEKDLAVALKELVESNFLGLLDVFVSSDESSISAGSKWLENITGALKECSVAIILCSKKSVLRPWINFEAGAAWIRDIPVIPLCHSGMDPSQLPIPLSLLQAAKISESQSLRHIIPVLADAINAKTPVIDFSEFVMRVKEFEENYTYWDVCNDYFDKLKKRFPSVYSLIMTEVDAQIALTETEINLIELWMDEFFTKNGLLTFVRNGGAYMTTKGTFYYCMVSPLPELQHISNNPRFRQ